MADEDMNNNDIADETLDTSESQDTAVSPNKKIILILVPIIILLIGAAVLYFSGFLGKTSETTDSDSTTEQNAESSGDSASETPEGTQNAVDENGVPIEPIEPPKDVYFDLPDILVNLNSGTKNQAYLKVVVTIALPDAATSAKVENNMPRILDSFQVYLRELTVDEIQGSAGMFRLKEELVERINRIISPSKINDVLFKEMLIQ